jgi:hypothetical protein
MDKETIKQIAAEIAAQLPFGERTGPVLVLYVIITAVAVGLAAWFGSFLKTKGQNFATKQDFDDCWSSFGPILKWSNRSIKLAQG